MEEEKKLTETDKEITEIKKEVTEAEKQKAKKRTMIWTVVIIIISICILFFMVIQAMSSLYETIPDEPLAKPIIYIYPEEEMKVSIKLEHPEYLTTVYPEYKDSWEVIAQTNGDLIDLNTNTKLYALYWEGEDNTKINTEEGFVIKGEDTATFLEEKLRILGLNDREINEFIIYWLPKMSHNEYNYVRFRTIEEIEDYMEMEITPSPDTLIRVYMDYKPLDNPIEIKEQNLQSVEREGYTVVEWGGREIK